MSMSTTQHTRTWLITGCSSGFGYEIALAALTAGDQVVATARQTDSLTAWTTQFPAQVLVLSLDVTNAGQVDSAVEQAVQRFGRLDVVVNNAGYGLVGAIEEVSDAEFRSIFDTDVFGVLNVTRAVLPTLRRQRSGHIINFSSVAGIRGSGGLGAYNAAKFAVEGLSEALNEEVAPLGLFVTIIEPGGFRTNWGGKSMRFSAAVLADYAGSAGRVRGFFESAQMPRRAGGNPKKLAQAVLHIAHQSNPPRRLALGEDAYGVVQQKCATLLNDLEANLDLTLNMGD